MIMVIGSLFVEIFLFVVFIDISSFIIEKVKNFVKIPSRNSRKINLKTLVRSI